MKTTPWTITLRAFAIGLGIYMAAGVEAFGQSPTPAPTVQPAPIAVKITTKDKESLADGRGVWIQSTIPPKIVQIAGKWVVTFWDDGGADGEYTPSEDKTRMIPMQGPMTDGRSPQIFRFRSYLLWRWSDTMYTDDARIESAVKPLVKYHGDARPDCHQWDITYVSDEELDAWCKHLAAEDAAKAAPSATEDERAEQATDGLAN
jgi:hypothetical protein